MIVYDLKCSRGHTFEGWFEDSKVFEQQQSDGLITCPVCNDQQVVRIPSTFAIKSSPASESAKSHDSQEQILARAISDYMEKNFENVGADFTREALKIHYGVGEPRNIRGVSTPQEEETLRQEGVSFFKFPPAGADPDPTPESEKP